MTTEAAINDAMASRQELDLEAELVRRARARSQEAWTRIYDQTHPKLFRYVLARTGDRDLAEDLTATVFVEALKGIGSYTHRGRPLLAWLYRIARNVVNYHHRSAFRKQARLAVLGPSLRALSRLTGERRPSGDMREAPAINGAGQASDPALEVESWDLRGAIDRLSTHQRETIILRYFVGLTTPEVARVLGKHERAVYSLQTRAIKSLRRHLR